MKTPQQMITDLMAIGMTQSEIGEKVGLTQGRISQIQQQNLDCSFVAGMALIKLHEEKTKKSKAVKA
jgi:transcriptional regulator with XRE-family HTH domain